MSEKPRVAITGGPGTGKTTMARTMDPSARSTDTLKGLGWSKESQACSEWFEEGGVVEGVVVPRALRKWLQQNPEGRPVDEVVFLTKPHKPLTSKQEAMGKGVRTTFEEIKAELLRRGVKVSER